MSKILPRKTALELAENGVSYAKETKAVSSHLSSVLDLAYFPITQPIFHTSIYRVQSLEAYNDPNNYIYCRDANPTNDEVEAAITSISGGAAGTLLYGSGMAAVTTALTYFLSPGDHLIAVCPIYEPTYKFITGYLNRLGIETTFLSAIDLNKNVCQHIKTTTKAIYCETPTNPLLELVDMEALGKFGQQSGIITIVDTTFGPPFVQYPIQHGIDIVLQSCTKYLGGHSDLMAGSITTRRLDHWQQLYAHRTFCGNILSPFDASLLLRGIKTVHLRVERECDNAMELAKLLENHPKVASVKYPGLPSHPDHELAKRQMKKFGSMVTFAVKGGCEEAKIVVENTKLFGLAASLGSVESLIKLPAKMSGIQADENRIQPNVIRLSVGIEDIDDLKRDLLQALGRV